MISYCLETGELILKTPVLRFSTGFRHDSISAPLPACALSGPAKFCPLLRAWVPRSTADPAPADVSAAYDQSPWLWWG